MQKFRQTPLHHSHLRLKARMVEFAGFSMPVQYTSILEESKSVRTNCGLFDVSHMGQFSLYGKDGLENLQKLVTNDLSRLSPGQAQYNLMCLENGGTVDDIVVYRRAADRTFICVNASNRIKDFEWIRSHLNPNAQLVDESDEIALLALQGPRSQTILEQVCNPSAVQALKYYWSLETEVLGSPCYLSRTGYTGEDGFELYLKNQDATRVWDGLLEIGRTYQLVPCGLGARDTLRLEMGYALYGHELDVKTSPISAGLSWVVKLDKATPFVGKQALLKESQTSPQKRLCGLKLSDRRIARQGCRILDGHLSEIGTITSGTFSPHLGCPIALGYLNAPFQTLSNCSIEIRESTVSAQIVCPPFVPSKTKK